MPDSSRPPEVSIAPTPDPGYGGPQRSPARFVYAGSHLPVGGSRRLGAHTVVVAMLVAVSSPHAPAMAVIDRWYRGTES